MIFHDDVTLTFQAFLYSFWYFLLSVAGNFNAFFFAVHLMDIAICFKTLGTILQSVTHNGKQVRAMWHYKSRCRLLAGVFLCL